MKQFFNHFILAGSLCFALACSEKAEVGIDTDIKSDNIVFAIEDFIPETITKSAFQASTMSFQWSEDDVIGIFPKESWQAEFAMQSGAGGNVAVFDGGSWGLKTDEEYYAYYPFSEENFESKDKRERVRYSYEGQEACFADENGVVNLGKYDFMASGVSKLAKGVVNFNFKHLGALCRVRFEAPARGNLTRLVLKSDADISSMSGYYDAVDKDADGLIALVGKSAPANEIILPIPSGHQAYNAGDKVELYFLLPPMDLSSGTLVFQLIDDEYRHYDYEAPGKNIKAGMSYAWDLVSEGDISDYTELSQKATANSYIVSYQGNYKFKTVKGNGTESVGAVSTAELLWESFGTDTAPSVGELVSNVTYADNYISFSTGTGGYKEGNALIAAKDAEGKILWSWHIWLTDQPENHVYNNNAGTMMDRNLGATSATPGDIAAFGLLYQWGRKDPFLGSSSKAEGTQAKSTLSWPEVVTSDASIGTIDYVTQHPTTFIKYNSKNSDWHYTGTSSVDNTRWQASKTIYDPCPAGYRIPAGGADATWAKAFSVTKSFDEDAFDAEAVGFNFGAAVNTKRLTDNSSVCWYPAAGNLLYSNGSLRNVGNGGSCWSYTPTRNRAYCFYFDSSGYVYPSSSNYLAYGLSVRCCRE